MKQLPVIFFAIFLIPTKYNFIRQTYIPSVVSPAYLLAGTISMMIAIETAYNGGKIPPIPKRLLIPYAGIVSLMLLSLAFTPNLEYGLSKVFEFITITTLACFAPFFLFRNSLNIKHFFHMVIFVCIVLIVILAISRPYSYAYK